MLLVEYVLFISFLCAFYIRTVDLRSLLHLYDAVSKSDNLTNEEFAFANELMF
jgi:hypothetical protein